MDNGTWKLTARTVADGVMNATLADRQMTAEIVGHGDTTEVRFHHPHAGYARAAMLRLAAQAFDWRGDFEAGLLDECEDMPGPNIDGPGGAGVTLYGDIGRILVAGFFDPNFETIDPDHLHPGGK